jgi:putative lipoic acid-binding regulatory protein
MRSRQEMKDLLDVNHRWPCSYTFKFIVPADRIDDVRGIFKDDPREERRSSNGRYVSMTVHKTMPSAEAVLNIYDTAAKIAGLIAL